MKKVIINENQKGFLFHNGRFVKLLGAGKYPLFGAREIEIVSLKEPLMSAKCELDTLLANSEVAKLTSVCEVADQQLALHYTSGKFDGVLRRGKYAFWSVLERHEYQLVDISTPEVAEDVPQYIFAKLPTTVYTKVEVAQYQKARLYFDQKLIRILDAGTYYFWKNNIRVDVNLVDTRLTRMEITGQEIMTQDMGRYFSSKRGLYHYIHMAAGNYREYIKGDMIKAKKYFYVLRPVLACRWILDKGSPPPMLFSELMESGLAPELKPEVERLLELKVNSPEIRMIPQIRTLNEYLSSSIAEIEQKIARLPNEREIGWEELNELFLSQLM